MRQLKPFTALYLVAAMAFTVFGVESTNFPVIAVGLLTFISAICSSQSWWRRTAIALGKGNAIFGWTVIAILVGLQVYGLVSRHFGFSPLLISIIVLMLIGTVEAVYILRSYYRDVQ